ncbi:MAG: ATP-grasp domain-containing protein [Rhodobacteraceae bacterium]|nr:ATP-grasp domain-containing protein [Paracoccaceae bacterium]
MKTILLTAIGGDIAQGVATIIRQTFPEWRIVGADMRGRHGGKLFVDTLLVAPAATDSGFEAWLGETISEHAVDFCIPFSEEELGFFCERNITKVMEAEIITPGFKALEVGNDKLLTAEFLAGIDIPGPWTVDAGQQQAGLNFPCIYKPRRGAGSKAIFICKTQEEADFYTEHYPGGIYQELLLPADQEVTCAIYRTAEGKVVTLQLLRTLAGGFTSWAQVIQDDEVERQCTQIANALDLRGSINVQLRITDEGPRIFEINSRFSSTILLRHIMGFQDAVWTLQEKLGLPIELYSPSVGVTGVRVQSGALVTED